MVSFNPLPPGLMIAAPRSGAGKTTVTLGLLRALKNRGLTVQPFKAGPDYIDPAFHTAAAARTSFNIDSWAMSQATASGLLHTASQGADLVVAEALMGLFDGVETRGQWGNGSSADTAALTGWPVVLVLDVSGQSQTVAATARGFRNFRDRVEVAGAILNRSGSDRHVRLATAALRADGIPVFGALPRNDNAGLPERHLGLVQAEETSGLNSRIEVLAQFIEKHVDVGALVKAATPGELTSIECARLKPPGQRIALARDQAFSFVYPHLVTAWRNAGAEIIPFSPLNDEGPESSCDVAWLPGGYPELHAGRLASAENFKSALTKFAAHHPVHGECGGYMTLGAGLVDAQGARHEMVGLLGLETSFAQRKMQLGYRRATLQRSSVLGEAGASVRGHEFHYATILSQSDDALFEMFNADGDCLSESGAKRGNTTGSFFHFIDVDRACDLP